MNKETKQKESSKNSTRRKFLKTTALGVGMISTLGSFNFTKGTPISKTINSDAGNSNDIPINLAGYDYNRVTAIIDGKVKIQGCSITYSKAGIGDMNSEAFSGAQSYDVTEIGLHPFMLAYSNDNFRDYSLLPIFPLRLYRHKSVFIRNDRGIKKPEDLKGKTIGTAGYSSTSLTWLRGLFQDEYNVRPEDVQWIISKKDSSSNVAGRVSKQEQVLPKGLNIKTGPVGKDESDLLVSGEVDALFHGVEPKAFVEGNPLVERLFPDSRKVEQAYFSKTGIFPIMHAVAVKKTLIEKNPWIAKAIFDAYSEAKQMDYKFMKKLGWAYDSLPWYGQELEATRKIMGENFWPYGIEVNRKTLETLFRYSYEQGLCSRELTIEELFHPSSLEFIESIDR
jgi:4,5-dihydroxyphthalate decarboxylase